MKRKVYYFLIFIVLIFPISTNANIMCNDGTISPSCVDCHRGCCSHHGGCSGGVAVPKTTKKVTKAKSRKTTTSRRTKPQSTKNTTSSRSTITRSTTSSIKATMTTNSKAIITANKNDENKSDVENGGNPIAFLAISGGVGAILAMVTNKKK